MRKVFVFDEQMDIPNSVLFQSTRSLALPLLMQKREANAASARIYHSTGENSSSQSSHVPSEGRSVATHSHKRKSSRNTTSAQGTHPTSERIRTEQQEIRDFPKQFRADEAIEGEQTALSRLSEAEFHTGLFLEEQRNHVFSEAKSEMNMQQSRAESADYAIRELNRQIHYHPNHGFETSRWEQACFQAVLEIRARAHQTARINKTVQRSGRIEKDLLAALKLRELKIYERMNFPDTNCGKPLHSESGTARWSEFFDWRKRFSRSWDNKQFWIIPRFWSTFNCSQSIWKALPRF